VAGLLTVVDAPEAEEGAEEEEATEEADMDIQ
jgi:hypothetical protein